MIQLATIKNRLGLAEADVKDDDLLTAFIAGVTARFESACNRTAGGTLTTNKLTMTAWP